MNVESELLWPWVALLLLLGTVAGLCVRCSRPAVKKSEKIYEQRSLEENQQNLALARTYSLIRQAWPGPLADADSDIAPTRKDKLLRFSPSLEDSESSRYQNFSKESRHGSRSRSDAAYVEPITTDYYNWGQIQKPREDDDDDDANSYENVLICKPKDPESGDEGSEDYQNSASIRQWRESRRAAVATAAWNHARTRTPAQPPPGWKSPANPRDGDWHSVPWSVSCRLFCGARGPGPGRLAGGTGVGVSA
ncbi:linker for activation of T-cells family member 2 isoform X2 [Callorhinus ursinus]|uniref:Linker for activation of T-cells family member 2 isoform X2 n=1 Tax=Callorhinus ursinus TaxID=34884 RepID=A0A3Q7PWB3_CALUR|nr:linker for activation of T-cells family member 2 isoform X2 [Callorhinus ursinus]